MKKIKLGKSNLSVSELALGCMYLGTKESREESFKRIDQYANADGNFLDTANNYAHWFSDKTVGGESEILIGEWLKKSGLRNQMVIATKMCFTYPGVEYGSSAKKIKEECEKSLLRMGIDTIDLYYMHSDDLNTPMEESLYALNDLYKEGKIRAIGASNFKAWRLERARQISKHSGFLEYSCVQQRYSYLRPKSGWDFGRQIAANDDLLEYVKDADIKLIAYSPLLSGAYGNSQKSFQKQYVGPDSDERLKVLAEIAKETGATKYQLVYAWLMQSDPNAIPLVASTTDEQFAEALGTLNIKLSQSQIDRMSNARY